MTSITAIAFNTFKEAVRNRVLYIILFFALIMIGISGVVSELTIADQRRVIVDLGFAAINLFGVAIAVFVGVSLVYNELEKKTIYTIVSKPISRWQFLLGKFFGLLMTIYINVVIMTLFFLFMLHYEAGVAQTEQHWLLFVASCIGRAAVNFFWWGGWEATHNIMPVIAATAIELGIVTAVAILFSAFTTPTLSMFFTVMVFIAGRLNADIVQFAQTVHDRVAAGLGLGPDQAVPPGELPVSYWFAQAAARITPNLEIFHTTVELAHYEGAVVIWWQSIVYAVFYSAAVLCLAMFIFHRRNFK